MAGGADSTFDEAFTRLLGKATADALAGGTAQAQSRPVGIDFTWTGGGLPLVLANLDPILVEVPIDSSIVWAHLYAGDANMNPVAVSATVDVQRTTFATFASRTPLYGLGLIPTLSAGYATDCDLTLWNMNFIVGDTIIARVASFTGTATWLALVLQLRPTQAVQLGVDTVTDSDGNTITDSAGNTLVLRS